MKLLSMFFCVLVSLSAIVTQESLAATSGIILIEQSALDGAVETGEGQSYCLAAKHAVRASIDQFFDGETGGARIAIWVSAGPGSEVVTDGFVVREEALAALDRLSCGQSGERMLEPGDVRGASVALKGRDSGRGGVLYVICRDGDRVRGDLISEVEGNVRVNVRSPGDPVQGACCFVGSCQIMTEAGCLEAGGEYLGDNVECGPDVCLDSDPPDPFEAMLERKYRWLGDGPAIPGACCQGDDCSIRTQAECAAVGGVYQGDGTNCSPNPCFVPEGACCVGSTCTVRTAASCSSVGGTYQGDGTDCSPNPCYVPEGACCVGSDCSILTPSACAGVSGVYQGNGTDCSPNPCESVCYATGDVDGDGSVVMSDLTLLTEILYVTHDVVGIPLFRSDVNGDCVVDTTDLLILWCYANQEGTWLSCGAPSYPVPTCCDPIVVFPPDRVIDTVIGEGDIDSVGDTTQVCNIDETGDNGIRMRSLYGSNGMSMKLKDVDLDQDNAAINFEIAGEIVGKKGIQVMSGVGVYQEPSGTIQVTADYSFIGDLQVLIRVFSEGAISGQYSVSGGGVVAVGYDDGAGLPTIDDVFMRPTGEPTFKIQFGSRMRFELTAGPTMYGDEMHLIAANATDSIRSFDRVDITGKHLVCFGLYDVEREFCCRGMTGNTDCSMDDFVTMIDLTRLMDHLFISLAPLVCFEESDLDGPGDGQVTMGDLTILIDHLFISLDPLPACP